MRTQVVVSTLFVMLIGFVLCQTCIAQGQRAQRAREAFAERIQDMDLSDEQEAKIAEVSKEFRPKIEPQAKELASLVQEEVGKIQAILTPAQKEMLKNRKDDRAERRSESLAERLAHLEDLDFSAAEMAKLAEIRKNSRPEIAKALERMKGTLSDDQKKARAEALDSGKKHSEVITALKLTDEQKEKLTAAGKEVRAQIREDLEKLRGILTTEQREKVVEFRQERREDARDHLASAIENSQDLNLTDEQKKQIAAIRQEYRPKIHAAGDKLRAQVRDELAAVVAAIRD